MRGAELGEAELLELQLQGVLGFQLREVYVRHLQGRRDRDPGVHVSVTAAPTAKGTMTTLGHGNSPHSRSLRLLPGAVQASWRTQLDCNNPVTILAETLTNL